MLILSTGLLISLVTFIIELFYKFYLLSSEKAFSSED